MSETIHKTMWWWFWQTEKVEAMLEGMAAQGWHMIQASRSCTAFVFEKGMHRRVRYCADYQETEKPEYLVLFSDAGWTMAHKGSGWYIWRKEYEGDTRPELYTDTDSLIRKNNRLLASLAATFAAQIPLVVVCLDKFNSPNPFIIGFMTVWCVAIALLAGICIVMALGIARMKNRARGRGR